MISEADLKRTVTDYLGIGQAQGKWMFLRLNAGDFIEVRGDTRRRVKGCPKGTADYLVIKKGEIDDYCGHRIDETIFLELKSEKGRQTKEQTAFQKLVQAQGAGYLVIRSIEELMEMLK